MSSSPTKVCAICVRETSKFNEKLEQIRRVVGTRIRKHQDDDLTQVTEPHWLRRGNLKATDFVCKPHLAILMRGMDYGSEGGCCSPLHRGARICSPKGLRTIPPDWLPFFKKHPKIIAEDKSCMLICWGCYKKHMEKMSRFGNPMGRSFAKTGEKLQRSQSLCTEDFLETLEKNTQKFCTNLSKRKSLQLSPNNALHEFNEKPTSTLMTKPAIRSISNASMQSNGQAPKPFRRRTRAERRSPSPPNPVSPVLSRTQRRRRNFQTRGLSQSFSHATTRSFESNRMKDYAELDEDKNSSKPAKDESSNALDGYHNESNRLTDVGDSAISEKNFLTSFNEIDERKVAEDNTTLETANQPSPVQTKTPDMLDPVTSSSDSEEFSLGVSLVSSGESESLSSESSAGINIFKERVAVETLTTSISAVALNSSNITSPFSPRSSIRDIATSSPILGLKIRQRVQEQSYQGEDSYPTNFALKIPRDSLLRNTFQHNPRYLYIVDSGVALVKNQLVFHESTCFTLGTDKPAGDQAICVKNIDLLKQKNMERHKTNMYNNSSLILRRGQPFDIVVELGDSLDWRNVKLCVELLFGSQPMESNGTHIFLDFNSDNKICNNFPEWSMRLNEISQNKIFLSIHPPHTCNVGKYQLVFELISGEQKTRWRLPQSEYIIILFNPWCVDDPVYLPSNVDRNEYVLDDVTFSYVGSRDNLVARPWILGQFDEGVLEMSLDLLSDASREQKSHNVVSAVKYIYKGLKNIESEKDLHKKYKSWSCFFETLNEVAKEKDVCVVVLSILRCLGIPSRLDCGFDCAAQTDQPMIVNSHFNEEGESLEMLNRDKIRPHHQWISTWTSRIDLSPGFGGWQAINLSRSGDISGPSPLNAIKKGCIWCGQDTEFYYKLINYKTAHYMVQNNGRMYTIRQTANLSTASIYTKSTSDVLPHDITNQYKFITESEEAKLAENMARMHCQAGRIEVVNDACDTGVSFDIKCLTSSIKYGENVEIVSTFFNSGFAAEHAVVQLEVKLIDGNGCTMAALPRETILAEIPANEYVDVPVHFNVNYISHLLSPESKLQATGVATLKSNNRKLFSQCTISVVYPELDIQVHGEFRKGGEITIAIRLKNVLPIPMLDCETDVKCSTLLPMWVNTSKLTTLPNETYKCERIFRCRSGGVQKCVVQFSCANLRLWKYQEIEIPL